MIKKIIQEATLSTVRLCRTDLVDKNLHFYWCRTRIRGVKRLRNSESLEDQVEVTGSVGDNISMAKHSNVSFRDLGIQSAAEVESVKTEACNR